MRTPTRDAFQDRFCASAMVMTFSRALAANLRSVALVGFMVRDLLAIVALFWSVTTLEHFCGAGFSSSHKKPFADESPGFGTFLKVYDHRAVRFGDVSLAEPCYFHDVGIVLSTQGLSGLCSNFISLIQYRNTTNVIDSDGVEVISQDAGSWRQFRFRYAFHHFMFALVPTGDPDAMGILWIPRHRLASPRGVI
jgi:hypothetical protein